MFVCQVKGFHTEQKNPGPDKKTRNRSRETRSLLGSIERTVTPASVSYTLSLNYTLYS